jgi:hypothetical protein
MTSLLSIRKAVISCFLAFAAGGAGFSQSYTTNGLQYAILPATPGDQLHPQLAINPQGGYLVWDDNAVDGRGQGIGALALDNNFSAVGSHFRVNQIGAADQEMPRAALLNNGGAVFVWEGGPRGSQHIYARFLGAGGGSNYWIGGDVLVNTFTNHYQINPVVATLTNGNVVIVWSSYDEYSSSSMLDIYGQVFSASGGKIGGEFLVNQFTAYNQRTPALAALPNGGFVVAWVSEQEQSGEVQAPATTNEFAGLPHPSVDIYFRLYDGNASPVGNELLADANSLVCANPSVAVGSDGNFMLAWSGKAPAIGSSEWDVYARPFSASGSPLLSVEERLNATADGDQFAPKLSSIASQYQAVWSHGLQGGVFAQFLNGDGSFSGTEYSVGASSLTKMMPASASDASKRFLVVWSSFNGLASGVDLFAQLYAPPGYTPGSSVVTYHPVLYDPYPDPSLIPVLAMPAEAELVAVSNAFASAQGNYHGLFYDTNNGVTPATAGYLKLDVTKKGTYSGAISLAGRQYAISGRFNSLTGWATNTIGKGDNAITVQLQLDTTGTYVVTGWVLGTDWTAQLQGDLQATREAVAADGYSGYYVMTIPQASSGGPEGTSYGTAKVDVSGNVKWNGTLSDGTKVSQSSGISVDGIWPLYGSLYGGKGAVMAWMQFVTNGGLGGELVWIKPSTVKSKSYREGFTNDVDTAGSAYVKTSSSKRLLDWTNSFGYVVLSGGGLSEPLTNSFKLEDRDRVTVTDAKSLSLNINSALGLFSGKMLDENGQRVPFSGVLWPDGVGLGFFTTTNQSGEASLAPAPAP